VLAAVRSDLQSVGWQGEFRLWKIVGLEETTTQAAIAGGFQPFNAVIRLHGVRVRANPHPHASIGPFDQEHVLVTRSLAGLVDHQDHLRPAAVQFAAARGENLNDVSAHVAAVHLPGLRHGTTTWS
jgi:hypothetical protein